LEYVWEPECEGLQYCNGVASGGLRFLLVAAIRKQARKNEQRVRKLVVEGGRVARRWLAAQHQARA
jgi:hypothetical protein